MDRIGLALAQSHTVQEAPTGAQLEQNGIIPILDSIVEPQSMGCSEGAKSKALSLSSDAQLLAAFDTLVEVMQASATTRLHDNLAIEAVRTMVVDGVTGSDPTPCAAIGSPAVDVGGLLASILLVAIKCAHARDAPPPAAPTWPPAPLSEHSPAHSAADRLWRSYVGGLSTGPPDSDEEVRLQDLLQLSAAYAGCEILRTVIGGASIFTGLDDERGRAERCALSVGRELVLHSTLKKLVTFDGVYFLRAQTRLASVRRILTGTGAVPTLYLLACVATYAF